MISCNALFSFFKPSSNATAFPPHRLRRKPLTETPRHGENFSPGTLTPSSASATFCDDSTAKPRNPMRQNAKPPPFPFLPSLSGSFSFQPSAMFPPQFTHSALLVPLQKISGLHNFKTVKASPHQGAKIPLVQRQKRIGKRKRCEKNRSVFCWRKDNWPIHHILVSHQPQIGFQPTPVGHGLLS